MRKELLTDYSVKPFLLHDLNKTVTKLQPYVPGETLSGWSWVGVEVLSLVFLDRSF